MPDSSKIDSSQLDTVSSYLARLAVRWRPNRIWSIVIVTVLILLIGWVDWVSGRRISYVLVSMLPVAFSTLWLGMRAGYAAAIAGVVVSDIGDLVGSRRATLSLVAWNSLADLIMLVVLVWFLHGLLTLYREVDDRVQKRTHDLQESNRERRRLERKLREAAASERVTIGQELHDDLCQQLVGTAFATKVLAEHLATSDAVASGNAHAIVSHIEDSISTARRIASDLLLEKTPPNELPDALADLAARTRETGISCRFLLEGAPAISDTETSSNLLRIAQEAVRNSLRHAKPTHVEILLGGNRQSDFLVIKDDGCGMPATTERGQGLGLRIIEQRATDIGGILSIRSASGKGTSVICHLPRQPPASQ